MDIHINDAFEDDLDALEIIIYGIPRQIYIRKHHFDDMDELNFFKRFRLTKGTVLRFLPMLEADLEFPYNTNQCVSPMNQLLICLRYYATGNHLLSTADFGGVHTSTVTCIVKRVSEAIARLYVQFIKFPTTVEEIRRTQIDFFRIASFPRVVGVIDCTHIKIQSPGGNDAEIFRNRKSYFSINVQAICNSSLEITNIVARWPGSAHDATIFNSSNIQAQFQSGDYPNSLLLGDSGYPIKTYLLTPLLNPVTEAEMLYNQSHIRTRNLIERCFGVLKRRFPVLAYGCRLKLETTLTVIVATSILHNIARQMGELDPPLPEDIEENIFNDLIENGQVPQLPDPQNQAAAAGNEVRANFINNYFSQL